MLLEGGGPPSSTTALSAHPQPSPPGLGDWAAAAPETSWQEEFRTASLHPETAAAGSGLPPTL